MANVTIGERLAAKRARAAMAAEQGRRRRFEASVAAAHKRAAGPKFGSSTEPQPRLRKPVIKVGR